ncbi:putative sorting nexin 14 [Operophtera brumata]|uniref:Putative sorting nexin 14 n=1 Tax=Operophtera brumata TaxID=104452 RepID=A0A0L7LMN2_OPEBR|nr:putative sorting nexin 14 [Operophtera brumata]
MLMGDSGTCSPGMLNVVTCQLGISSEHQNKIETEEYGVFLKFLLNFFYERGCADALPEFSDMLYTRGYLKMLPQVQIVSPEEATGPLLPFLVEHILMMPNAFRPPPYIIKALWLVLVDILVRSRDDTIVENCTHALYVSLDEADEEIRQEFSLMVWSSLRTVLSRALADDEHAMGSNICYLLELATSVLPLALDPDVCAEVAVLIAVMFSKDSGGRPTSGYQFEHVCLKMSLYLLYLANNQNDNRGKLNTSGRFHQRCSSQVGADERVACAAVRLLSHVVHHFTRHGYQNRAAFLPRVLCAAGSADERVACAAVRLISHVVHHFTRHGYQSLRRDSHSERGASLLQLVCTVLSSGVNTPLGLAYDVEEAPVVERQYNALRALMFRIQLMLCSRSLRRDSHSERGSVAPTAGVSTPLALAYDVEEAPVVERQYNALRALMFRIQLMLCSRSLRRDSYSERGGVAPTAGVSTPLALAYDVEEAPVVERQYNALRALMFRIQLMLCSRDSKNLSSAGWKTLSSIFKHAIGSKNDTNLVATLTSQPWTHILVQFQLEQQHIIPDFITFVHTWLTLLRITIKMAQERTRVHMSRHSLVFRTMALLKRHLKVEGLEGDLRVTGVKILEIVRDILRDSGMVEMFHDSGIAM